MINLLYGDFEGGQRVITQFATARRTLAVLRDEGLIYTVPQRGSYVR